jgi:hypothetical protein
VVQEIDSARLEAALAIVRQASARLAVLTDPQSPAAGESLRAVAERLYAERRKRDEYFPLGLFGEPAWDLLLALFIAQDDGRDVSLEDAYSAAKIEPREGPALIEKLMAAGLVARSRKRGNAILLTEHGMDRLSDYLADLI